MSDFSTTDLLTDWDAVLSRAGSLTAVTGGVTFSGVWAELQDQFGDVNDQLRDEKRFVIFTTYSQLATQPSLRQTVVRSGVTYSVQSVRADAERCGMEIDVRKGI